MKSSTNSFADSHPVGNGGTYSSVMSFAVSSDAVTIATALNRLENLGADEYFIAFGPDGKQFCGTPNGYAATHLPMKVLTEIAVGRVKKIVWASFGSEPDSWFFAYEKVDGTSTFRLGEGTPADLRVLIEQLSGLGHPLGSFRVQLGDRQSFVVWSRTVWACSEVPRVMKFRLCSQSSESRDWNDVTIGSLRSGTLSNVQWHHNGTYYFNNDGNHKGFFIAGNTRDAWNEFWTKTGPGNSMSKIEKELACVAIDPHIPTGATFAFIKKQEHAREAPYALRFGQEAMHTNVVSCHGPPMMAEENQEDQFCTSNATSLQHVPQEPDEHVHHQWAVSTKAGRPHAKESWELELKKGEKVQVLRDMGRDWYVVQGREGVKGWVHGSWLNFGDRKLHADAKTAYCQFQADLGRLLLPGELCSFPPMASYIDACTKPGCQLQKEDVSFLGICIHDLLVLLEGSGCYSYEWLKEGRNMWHPDRFARFCHPDHADRLKPMAEQMFVLYSILMGMSKVY